ncbi:hypothetical protein [Christensenella intestinihominis]|uniref:hypothetical protein n=1 Tax=Christensenella intestinihominis TaxID=1851429 RepID=UPI0008349C10|nr:hypothetical protein [Christensenella intestinihominis]
MKNNSMDYMDRVHRTGRISMIIIVILLLMVPILLCMQSGVWPQGDWILSGMLAVGMIYLPIGVIEVLNYSPLIGSGGTYLAFITGNISNMKLPCAVNALEVTKTNVNTREGEVISTISIAVSTIVTTVIVGVGVLLILPFKDFMITTLAPISEYILPSIFGALGVVFISKSWKLSIVPLLLMTLLFIFVIRDDSIRAVFVPVASLVSIVCARLMYKKQWV